MTSDRTCHGSENKCPKKSCAAKVSSAVIYNHRHWLAQLVATLKTMPTASLSRNPAGESTSKPPTMSFSFSSCCCALQTSCLAVLWPLQLDLGSADVAIGVVLCVATCSRILWCADRDTLALQERCRLCVSTGHALHDLKALLDCGEHRQSVLVICCGSCGQMAASFCWYTCCLRQGLGMDVSSKAWSV